jgi:hypothetical protein
MKCNYPFKDSFYCYQYDKGTKCNVTSAAISITRVVGLYAYHFHKFDILYYSLAKYFLSIRINYVSSITYSQHASGYAIYKFVVDLINMLYYKYDLD